MKLIGKSIAAIGMLLLFLIQPAHADLTAAVDRDRVTMGDTLRLTITATGSDSTDKLDMGPLFSDFEILQRSSTSSTSIINGRATRSRQLLLDIVPKREGTLRIPAMRTATGTTNLLLVSVGPAPKANSGSDVVVFEAQIDSDSVYVQGQLLLTLRVQQAINLDSRSISELQMDNAFVKQLEQKSFQRNIDGRPWLIHEIRYAIFPEQSGEIIIPSQTFTARESRPQRSLFDNRNGPLLRRQSEQLTVNVLPRPTSFPSGTWLPARNLQIEETWSTPPEQLRAGESATRTLRISGEGLQGAQLPPILFPSAPGLKYYPDQPAIGDTEISSGLLGTRTDSAALVPIQEGSWEIPEVRIPWWDTQSQEIRYAVVPARQLQVAPMLTTEPTVAPSPDSQTGEVSAAATTQSKSNILLWQSLAAFSTLGWILTLAYLLLRRPTRSPPASAEAVDNIDEKTAYKQLIAACASSDPGAARRYLLEWATSQLPQHSASSLEQIGSSMADQALLTQLGILDKALYAGSEQPWDGSALAEAIKSLRSVRAKLQKNAVAQPLQLYPQN